MEELSENKTNQDLNRSNNLILDMPQNGESLAVNRSTADYADDLISSLPDEILCHTISLLPFESAVQSSLLSKKWKNLWNTALVQHDTEQDVPSAVFRFLSKFNESDQLRRSVSRLQLNFRQGAYILATIASDNKLHLNFGAGKRKHSRPYGWKLKLNAEPVIHQLPQSTFFVKTLYLVSVTSIASEAVSYMVSSFQYLESLKIVQCNGLQSLKIDSSSKLRSLTVLDCPQLRYLSLRAHKLMSFRYRGMLPRLKNIYHFNLVDAMLDFRQGLGCRTFMSHDFDPVLITIKNAETLTLCRWTFKELILPSVASFSALFQFYKLKELWWIENSKGRWNFAALTSFLKLCPALESFFITCDPKTCYNIQCMDICTAQVREGTKLKNLKLVKLEGLIDQEDIFSFAECLRHEFEAQPSIVTTCDGKCWRRSDIVSPCELKNFKERGFYELVEDTDVLCLKHPHMGK